VNRRPLHLLPAFVLFFMNSWVCAQVQVLKPADKLIIDSLFNEVERGPEAVNKGIDSLLSAALSAKDSAKYGRLLDVRGLTKRAIGEYAEAIKTYQQAYDFNNSMRNKKRAAYSLMNIGIIMIRTARYEDAEKYLMDALNQADKSDSVMMKTIYINLGVAYDYGEKTQAAIDIYKKAAQYVSPENDPYSAGVLNHNIASCYSVIDDFKNSEAYEFIALEYQKKTGSDDLLGRIGISLGNLYYNAGMIDKATYYYQIGGDAAQKSNSIDLIERFYEDVIPLYVTKNNTKLALFYIDELTKLRKKMYDEENLKNIADAEAKFNVALKDKEIENLKISKDLLDLKSRNDRLARYVMLVIILLAVVVLIVMFRNFKLRKRNFELVTREKQLIEKEKKSLEKNNEYLSNENMLAKFEILKSQVSPHFMFNTLNALSFLIGSDTEKAVKFTNAFSKLFRIVLELKDQNLITLEEELNHVEAYFYLQRIRFSENLVIHQDIDPSLMQRKLPPFSIQIVVENAINHNVITPAEPLHLKIFCNDGFLFIENNLQLKKVAIKSTSIGIANIKARYSFFTDLNPEFIKEPERFIVKLPLLADL